MALRIVIAECSFVKTLMIMGKIDEADAEIVFAYYQKHKMLVRDAVGGVINVKHGAYLDRDVIQRALILCDAKEGSSTAMRRLHAALVLRGWKLNTDLKVPHATSPDGEFRLWFKADGIHFSEGKRHSLSDAEPLRLPNWFDIRREKPAVFLSMVEDRFGRHGSDMSGLLGSQTEI
jgi:hypothetical protein